MKRPKALGFPDGQLLCDCLQYEVLYDYPAARWCVNALGKCPENQKCYHCGLPATKDNPLTVAHLIPIGKGLEWFGIVPNKYGLNNPKNLRWAHKKVCNAATELNEFDSLRFLYSDDGYGYKGELLSYVSPERKARWDKICGRPVKNMVEEIFPQLPLKPSIVIRNGMFLSEIAQKTLELISPDARPKPKKSYTGKCLLCNSTNRNADSHERAHLIGLIPGIHWFGLTPEWLNSDVNIVWACRTRKNGKRCNAEAELGFVDSMIFLKRIVGVKSLPPYLPSETHKLWNQITSKTKVESPTLKKLLKLKHW